MADGLDVSAGKLAEPTRGDLNADSAAQAVRMTLVRGRKDLDGLLWGDLFPAKEKRPGNIHKVMKDFPVREVLEIAAGTHPFSRVTDVVGKQMVPSPQWGGTIKGVFSCQYAISVTC